MYIMYMYSIYSNIYHIDTCINKTHTHSYIHITRALNTLRFSKILLLFLNSFKLALHDIYNKR